MVARIDDVVGRGTAIYIQNALDYAESKNAPLVIELNTPGGLVDATLEIDNALAQADVPVLTYVGPGDGAFAASAGTFILLMGNPAGMAEGASIGSAQPIQTGPGGTTNASSKVSNFLVERIRSIAERHDRDPDTAERFITENLNMAGAEALDAGMVDVLAGDLRSFLVGVDGMVVSGEPLRTAGARVERVEPGTIAQTIDVLGDPTIAFVLMMAGLYALIFGLANPGTYVPETIGAIMLLLGLLGLGLFGVSTAGFLLIMLAVVFFIAEVFTPTHGILSVAGVATLILAVIFLVDAPLLPRAAMQQFTIVAITLAVLSGGVVFGAVSIAMRSRTAPPTKLDIGDRGVVVEAINPEGTVEAWGEVWTAKAQHPIGVGAHVRILKRDGLMLTVTEEE